MQRSLEEVKGQLQVLKPALGSASKWKQLTFSVLTPEASSSDKSDLGILVAYSEMVDLLLVASLRRYLRRKLRVKVDVVSERDS